MTFLEFVLLSDDEKADAIDSGATILAHRISDHHFYILYQLDSFYIESKMKGQELELVSYCASGNTSIVEPYLKQLGLDQLDESW